MAMYVRLLSNARRTGQCTYQQCRNFLSSTKKVEQSPEPKRDTLASIANRRSTKLNMSRANGPKSLTTIQPYFPPDNIMEIIKNIACKYLGNDGWSTAKLDDPLCKFKIISEIILETDHDVPNFELTEMTNMGALIRYFKTEVTGKNAYEDLAEGKVTDLPKNLHIILEAHRFDPQTDTMFSGRTAFPGSDSVVRSIKYRRKYENIKTTKEEPGFYNHYYGY